MHYQQRRKWVDLHPDFENSGNCQATNTMGSFLSTASTSSLRFWLRISDLFMNKVYHIVLKLMKQWILDHNTYCRDSRFSCHTDTDPACATLGISQGKSYEAAANPLINWDYSRTRTTYGLLLRMERETSSPGAHHLWIVVFCCFYIICNWFIYCFIRYYYLYLL